MVSPLTFSSELILTNDTFVFHQHFNYLSMPFTNYKINYLSMQHLLPVTTFVELSLSNINTQKPSADIRLRASIVCKRRNKSNKIAECRTFTL